MMRASVFRSGSGRLAVAACVAGGLTAAAPPITRAEVPRAGLPASVQPAALRGVGMEQRLGDMVPLELEFRDETGAPVRLGGLLRGKPVILNLAYYNCPMLCPLVMNGLTSAMQALPFAAGEEFDVITVSIDPSETPAMAAEKKATYLQRYGRPGAARGWRFLTGDAASIERLSKAVGFNFRYDDDHREFAHAAGLIVLTPQGTIARYFFGVEFSPRDLKFGLMEAANARIGSPIDQLLLFCYHYDPASGRYSAAILDAVRAGGVLTLLAAAAFIVRSVRRERRAGGPPAARPAAQAGASSGAHARAAGAKTR